MNNSFKYFLIYAVNIIVDNSSVNKLSGNISIKYELYLFVHHFTFFRFQRQMP